MEDKDQSLATYFAGITTAAALFTLFQAVAQTRRVCCRSRRMLAGPYIALLWVEWSVNVVWALIVYLYMMERIPQKSFGFFFGIICLWVLQIQCIMQIIINRISLIMYTTPARVARLKWGVAIVLSLVNLGGFVVWIPAKMGVNDMFVTVNNVWNRCEKVIFLLTDLCLNAYFVHLVRANLLANGLTKYRDLFRMNMAMIFFSISMDITLIGLLSMGNVYLTFHPVVYLVKLSIEMNMADLIAKITKSSSHERASKQSQPVTETFNVLTPLPPRLAESGLAGDTVCRSAGESVSTTMHTPGQRCSCQGDPEDLRDEIECPVWDGCVRCRLGREAINENCRDGEWRPDGEEIPSLAFAPIAESNASA